MKLLLTEAAHSSQAPFDLLSKRILVERADLNREELLAQAPSADVLWVKLRNRIDREVIGASPRLSTIVTATTGLNHIDLEAAADRRINVLSLRGEVDFLKEIRATAELTIGLILSLTRRIPAAAAHAREGRWQREAFQGNDLYGKTAGIVGYGRLGRIVGDYLAAFGMKVLATSPGLKQSQASPQVRVVSRDALLDKADLVSLHVNLCRENERFFDESCFARMKPGAWFINTSRGELIDEAALRRALATRQLRGAAVDVLAGEDSRGMADHLLVKYAQANDNLLITPHIGGNTIEAVERTEMFLARKLYARLPAKSGRRTAEARLAV